MTSFNHTFLTFNCSLFSMGLATSFSFWPFLFRYSVSLSLFLFSVVIFEVSFGDLCMDAAQISCSS